jgi:hypothetical protein
VGLWIFPLFHSPIWILVIGTLFAAYAAPRMGGAEAAEGSEEFSFALPASRGDQYLARLAIGLPALLLFCGTGALAIGFDLPQKLWSVFVSSGFTQPFGGEGEAYFYGLAVCAPVAVFAVAFVQAALTRSPAGVSSSWFVSISVNGLAGFFALFAESQIWDEPNGYLLCPVLVLAAASSLALGYYAYCDKEGISRPAPESGTSAAFGVFVIVVVVVFLLLLAILWVGKDDVGAHEEAYRDRQEAEETMRTPEEPNQRAPESVADPRAKTEEE